MSFHEFIDYVSKVQGEEILTAGGRSTFKVEVNNSEFRYEISTGKTRRQPMDAVERIYNLYLERPSLHPGDYTYDTYNASYILALLGGYFSTDKSVCIYTSSDNVTKIEEGLLKERSYLKKSRSGKLVEIVKHRDGYTCIACEFRLKVNGVYVIDCHHLFPISMGHRESVVEDLVCLCPNCHRIAHRRNPPYSIDEIKRILKKHNNRKYLTQKARLFGQVL